MPQHGDPAVIPIERICTLGLNLTGSGGDDPDIQFYENYVCGASRNFSGYCNKETDAPVDAQSQETDFAKRRAMVWDIDKRLQEDFARPIIYVPRSGTCQQPWVKNVTVNGNRMYIG